MRCNPALSNCRVVPQKIGIKWLFLPLCPRHGWKIKLNAKLNGVIIAMWWNTVEFKWGSVADAELYENRESNTVEGIWGDWAEICIHREAKKIHENDVFEKDWLPLHWNCGSVLMRTDKFSGGLKWCVIESAVNSHTLRLETLYSLSAAWDRHLVSEIWEWNAANHATLLD